MDQDSARPSAVASEQEGEDPAHHRGADSTQRNVARDHPAACDQGQRQQKDRDAERTSVVDHRHQPGDAPRRRMDDLDDGLVDAGVAADDDYAAHEREDGTSQAGSVAPASTSLAVADRSEHNRAPATQEMWLGKRARTLYEVFSHPGPTALRVLLAAV